MIKLKLIIIISIFLLFVSNLVDAKSANRTFKAKGPIKCRLYSECIVDISEIEPIHVIRTEMETLNSSDLKVFNFEPPKIAEFREDGTETYKIKIIPVFIGHAKIEVFTSSTGEKRIIAEVIIERPNPIINKIFDYYLWVYCGLMSFCMGALIDSDLVNSLKNGDMHKQVGVAMFCKIIIMPLVIFISALYN